MTRHNAARLDTPTLRRQAKRAIDSLSGGPLRLAADFLSYIQERQPDAATRELMEIPGLADSLARGIRDVKAGRGRPWRKVRSDV